MPNEVIPAAPAAPAAPAPAPAAAPAAPAPAAAPASPAAPAGGAAAPATPPAGAAPTEKPGNIIADAGKDVSPTKDEQVAFLTAKGLKAEEIAKLDEAGVKAKFDELKAADAKVAAPGDIEVKLPEGATIDQEALDAFKGIIADAKLSPSERAQKLVDMYASITAKDAQGRMDLWFKTQADWQKEVKADKELGGENFDKVRSTIARALGQFGGEHETSIRQAMELTGAGNHPALVRVFYRMAAALVESGAVPGTAPSPGGDSNVAAMFYPTMN